MKVTDFCKWYVSQVIVVHDNFTYHSLYSDRNQWRGFGNRGRGRGRGWGRGGGGSGTGADGGGDSSSASTSSAVVNDGDDSAVGNGGDTDHTEEEVSTINILYM